MNRSESSSVFTVQAIKLDMTSQIKFKVVDLATGNKYAEEWKIVPNDWPYQSKLDQEETLFDKNFVLVDFDMWGQGNGDNETRDPLTRSDVQDHDS